MKAADGSFVPARVRPCSIADTRAFVLRWGPSLDLLGAPDGDWKWSDLASESEVAFHVEPEIVVLVAEAQDDVPLGVLVTSGPIQIDVAELDADVTGHEPVLWVEYIAIAPDLRPGAGRTPALKGVGPLLMEYAIHRSRALDCQGRIALHAEGSLAVTIYETKWNMRRLSEAPHPAGGTFPVFFGSAAWARDFLKESP